MYLPEAAASSIYPATLQPLSFLLSAARLCNSQAEKRDPVTSWGCRTWEHWRSMKCSQSGRVPDAGSCVAFETLSPTGKATSPCLLRLQTRLSMSVDSQKQQSGRRPDSYSPNARSALTARLYRSQKPKREKGAKKLLLTARRCRSGNPLVPCAWRPTPSQGFPHHSSVCLPSLPRSPYRCLPCSLLYLGVSTTVSEAHLSPDKGPVPRPPRRVHASQQEPDSLIKYRAGTLNLALVLILGEPLRPGSLPSYTHPPIHTYLVLVVLLLPLFSL